MQKQFPNQIRLDSQSKVFPTKKEGLISTTEKVCFDEWSQST